nr:hypothetical protein [Candidatus Krumholzibacteria bacterium]
MTDSPANRQRVLDVWLGLTGQIALPEGSLILPVLSGSMGPQIPLGCRIEIRPGPADQCRLGDVMVYMDEGRLVAHRLLWRVGPYLYTKGDANAYGHWIGSSQVKGLIVGVWPAENLPQPTQAMDPSSLAAAQKSRKELLHNIILWLPRKVRDLLRGPTRPQPKDEP